MNNYAARMKCFVLVALLATVVSANPLSIESRHDGHDHHTHTFTTLLDHFSPQNPIQVNFTYTEQADYFRPDGPIYIFIQDNGNLTTELLDTGVLHDIAPDTGAVLVTASNRFYRENIPTADASVANLRFLTIEQTLADIPYLIEAVRANLNGSANSRVILFGTGLGATLAGWARQKYPHLIDGVWSSSGQFERVVHSSVPLEHLSASIERIGGPACATDLGEAYESIAYLIAYGRVDSLRNDFNLCANIQYWSYYDLASFYRGIYQVLSHFIEVENSDGIHHLCDALATKDASASTPELDAYTAWFRSVYTSDSCLQVSIAALANEAAVEDWSFIQEHNWNANSINRDLLNPSRPTLWLICTQLGGFSTSVNARSLFQHAIGQDTFFRYCQAAFDDYNYAQLAGSVAALNRRYGGNNPLISNIIYTNALIDPWVSFGVHTEQRTENTHIIDFDYGRSSDLFTIRPHQTAELIATKERVIDIITEWGSIV